MPKIRKPGPPGDLASRGRGRAFWRKVVDEHELRADELELLAEAARMLDLLDALREQLDGAPLLVDGRAHPLLVEARQVREQLRKTLAALAVPDPPAEDEPVAEPADMRTVRARKAARARWDHA